MIYNREAIVFSDGFSVIIVADFPVILKGLQANSSYPYKNRKDLRCFIPRSFSGILLIHLILILQSESCFLITNCQSKVSRFHQFCTIFIREPQMFVRFNYKGKLHSTSRL
jgi:hypothetical protein